MKNYFRRHNEAYCLQIAPYAKIPLIRPGGDLVTGVKSNQSLQLGDLERHAVETTRKRMKLVMVLFVLIFAALGGRLIQLNTGDELHARHQAEKIIRPI